MKPMTDTQKVMKAKKDDAKPTEEVDNSFYTLHTLEILTFAPIDVRTCQAEELEQRCVDYFELCIRNDMKPSIAGLALALGCARTSLFDYISGVKKIPLDNQKVLIKYNGVLNALIEDYMLNGKVNPVAGIFVAKNNFGYKDAQEFVVNNTVQEEATPEALMQEAQLLLDAEPKKANLEG